MIAPQYDGGIDEQDRDQVEEKLAAAIAGILATTTATAPWLMLVRGKLSGILTAYLQRSALDMARSAGMSSGEAAQAASDAVNGVMADVERHTAAWLKQAAEDRAPKGGGAMGADQADTSAGIIARSLATYARERAREHVARSLGARFKTWVTRGDQAVRPGHAYLAGKTVSMGKPFQTEGFDLMRPGDPEAPLHLTAGCFIGDTAVQSPARLEGSYLRMYAGDLVTVETASGVKLTGTPNHPVFTQRGWVGLQSLDLGDYLVKPLSADRMGRRWPVVDEPPSEISQVHASLVESSVGYRVVVSAMDFHGDGAGSSEVQVVRTDLILGDPVVGNDNAAFIGLDLTAGDVATEGTSGGSTPQPVRHGRPVGDRSHLAGGGHSPAARLVGGFGVGEPRLEWSLGHPDIVGGRGVPGLHSGRDESLADGGPAGSQALSQAEFGLAIEVVLDPVQSVEVRPTAGSHVYNLQTETGWYIANGVIVSNCRCHLAYSATAGPTRPTPNQVLTATQS